MRQFHTKAILVIVFLLYPIIMYAQESTYGNFPYGQSFLSSSRPAEVSIPSVSSGVNAATFTPSGVRLTPAQNTQFGAIFINDRKFSSINGIKIEFEYMAYGGSGADGFTVFFFDSEVTNPRIGSNGAAIGYSYSRAIIPAYAANRKPGLTGGYLGIAFDSYGNFKSTRYQDDEIIDGIGIGKSARSHVTLRGARGVSYGLEGMGEGYTGYPVLVTQSTKVNTGTDYEYVVLESSGEYSYYNSNPEYSGNFEIRGGAAFTNESSAAYRKAIIELYPIENNDGMYITVKIQHGRTVTTVIDRYPYRSVTKYRERAIVSNTRGDRPIWENVGGNPEAPSPVINLQSANPGFLRLGFAAATGRSNDIHIIKNLAITLPGSAEANNDTINSGIDRTAVIYPFGNDVAYQGVISENQIGDSSYINPLFFKFHLADGTDPMNDYYHQTTEGVWAFDPATRAVTFVPASGFMGTATIQYSIKGGLPGHTLPYADEAYRSLPATITVNVTPQITAIPSSVLCGENAAVTLVLDSAVRDMVTDIQWYKDGILLPALSGEKACIVTEPATYYARVVISGTTYTTNSIAVTRIPMIIEQPYIHSEEELYEVCGSSGVVDLRIHEDDFRPLQQTYLWFKNGLPLYDETGYSIIVSTPGIYKLMVTEEGCSVFSNERNITQTYPGFRSPIVAIDPPNEIICNENGSVLLFVSNYAEYGSDALYKWYNDEQVIQSGSASTLFAMEAGTYRVRVITNGCSAISDPVAITISPADSIDDATISSISGGTVLCGDNGLVILQLTDGDFSPYAAYAWFRNGALLSDHPDYQKPTIHITDTGTYFLRVIDGSCSVLSNEIGISYSAEGDLPQPDFRRLPPQGQICANEGSVYLYIHNHSDYNNAVYRWLRGAEIIKTSSEPWYEAGIAGDYSVVISSDGCSIETDPITLNASGSGILKPVIGPVIGDSTLCDNEGVVILTLKNPSDFPGATGYQWYKDGLPVPGAVNTIFIARSEGEYRLQVVEANCSSLSDDYTVYQSPGVAEAIPELHFDPGLSVCNGGITQIEVINAALFPNATYLWYRDNNLIYTGQEYVYYTDVPGTYFVQVYYNGCSSVSDETLLERTGELIIPPDIGVEPSSGIICGENGAVIIRLKNFSQYVTPLSYQWYKNDEIIAGETAPVLIVDSALGAGDYRLRVQNGYGCVTFTNKIEVGYMDNSSIIKPQIVPESATVYPGSPPYDHVVITVTNVDPAVTEYLWYDEDELLRRDANTGTISYTTYQQGKFYVQAIYGNDCSSVSNISDIDNSENNAPQPILSVYPESREICENDGMGLIMITNLSEYTNPTFTWMKVGAPDSLVGTDERFVTNVPGIYYVIVFDHEDTLNPLPSLPSNRVEFTDGSSSIDKPVISNSGNKLCGVNGKLILHVENYADYSAASRYRWLRNGTMVQFGSEPSYIVTVPGTYTVQVFDGDCFSESSPEIIEYEDGAYPVPVIDFLGGNELQLCGENATVILHITNADLFQSAALQWFCNDIPLPGETGLFLRIDTTNKRINQSDYYRVQASFGDCSTLSDRREVRYYASSVTKPVLERFPSGGNLCGENSSVWLQIVNVSDLPGQYYYWFKNGNQIVQQGNNTAYEVTEAGIYTVYVTGTPCSSESAPENISDEGGQGITPPSIIAAGGDLCTGNSEWLLIMTTPESEYVNPLYQWYKGSSLLPGMNKPRLTVSDPGNYRLFVTDGNCGAFSEFVTVPSGSGGFVFKPVIAAVDDTICDNGRTLIQVVDHANFPGAAFNWYKENTLLQSGPSYSFYAEEAGYYYVHIVNSAGCSAVSSELELKSSGNEIGSAVLSTVPAPPVLCGPDGSVTVTLTNPQEFNGYSYQWYYNDHPVEEGSGVISNLSAVSITVSSEGFYRLRLRDDNCITFSDPVEVTYDAATHISEPDLAASTAAGCGKVISVVNKDDYTAGSFYTWYRDGTKIAEGADMFVYETNQTGNFHVSVLDGNCFTVSPDITIAPGGDTMTRLYVNRYVSNEGDGSTWETPLRELADAFRIADRCSNIEEIWVAEGTYFPLYLAQDGRIPNGTDNARNVTFMLPAGVKIYGGFPQNATTAGHYDVNDIRQRNWEDYKTILSGDIGAPGNTSDNAYHVVTANSSAVNTVLDGVRITGGNANQDLFITIYNGDILHQNYGAGIYVLNSNVIFRNISVYNNNASGGWDPAKGAGAYIVHANRAPSFINTAITGNNASTGAALYLDGQGASVPVMTNVTIAGNTTTSGAAIVNRNSAAQFHNSIIWGNGAANVSNQSSQIEFKNSLVQGSGGSLAWDTLYGNDGGFNIDTDPLWNSLYHLQWGSPAIDAGDSVLYQNAAGIAYFTEKDRDLGGSLRKELANIDMGAFEYSGFSLMGTVFPFVYDEEDPAFYELFPITVRLYAVPENQADPIDAVLNSEPLYSDTAVFYDGSVFVPGTPKYPGLIGKTNNPGLPIDWSIIGKTQDPVDTTWLAEGEMPDSDIGLYRFTNVHPGEYVLALFRDGFVTRFAKISVTGNESLGHRELIAGDVNGDLAVDMFDISVINTKRYSYGWPRYEPRCDFNGDGTINHLDISVLLFFIGSTTELYEETLQWLQGY